MKITLCVFAMCFACWLPFAAYAVVGVCQTVYRQWWTDAMTMCVMAGAGLTTLAIWMRLAFVGASDNDSGDEEDAYEDCDDEEDE